MSCEMPSSHAPSEMPDMSNRKPRGMARLSSCCIRKTWHAPASMSRDARACAHSKGGGAGFGEPAAPPEGPPEAMPRPDTAEARHWSKLDRRARLQVQNQRVRDQRATELMAVLRGRPGGAQGHGRRQLQRQRRC